MGINMGMSGPTYFGNMVLQPLAQTCPAAAAVVPHGFASEGALEAITMHPELIIGYYNHTFTKYNMSQTRDRSDEKLIISSGSTKVLAWRMEPTNPIWAFDYSDVLFVRPDESDEIVAEAGVIAPHYADGRALLNIADNSIRVERALAAKGNFIRDIDGSNPAYVPSLPLRAAEWLHEISKGHDLKSMHMLDMGGGTGAFLFPASHFFRIVTGIEIDPLVYANSLLSAAQLKGQMSLGCPVELTQGDFLSPSFSMKGFDLVYVYKPFYTRTERIIHKLRELEKGALVLTSAFAEPFGDQENFEALKTEGPYLFRRK